MNNSSKDVQELLTGQRITAANAHNILEMLGDNAIGRPQHERALIMFAKSVISDNERKHAGNLANLEAVLEERAAAITEQFDDTDEAVRLATTELDAGRIDAREARQRLAKADEQRRSLQGRVEQLRRDNEMATNFAAQDPAEWQAEMLQLYPALRDRLPIATTAELRKHA